MSRRDTIIIAVLINASLLAFLFVMAINVDEENVIEQPEIAKVIEEKAKIPPKKRSSIPDIALAQINSADEVDNLLKDLSMGELPHPAVIEEPYFPIVEEPKNQDVNYVEVTVKRGDVLSKIAQSNHTTVESIKKANRLNSEKLSIGQVLRVPVGAPKKPIAAIAPVAPLAPSLPTEPEYYVVKSGDNPWKIAKQFHVKFEDLLKLNNLDEEKARNLKVGDKIRVH